MMTMAGNEVAGSALFHRQGNGSELVTVVSLAELGLSPEGTKTREEMP